jgi:DNA mismatch endonuclease, patch repair protein
MDVFTPEKRSEIMRRVKSRDTLPEKKVRSLLYGLGFRFRLHRKDLPGHPDIVLPKHRTAIFVHGCFWHRHPGCPRATTPAARKDYWSSKFLHNIARDARNQDELRSLGWRVLVAWECELRDVEGVKRRLLMALKGSGEEGYAQKDSSSGLAQAAETNCGFGGNNG